MSAKQSLYQQVLKGIKEKIQSEGSPIRNSKKEDRIRKGQNNFTSKNVFLDTVREYK
jgi:hypothetical protein